MIAEAKAEVTEEVEDGKDEDEEEETDNSLVSLKFSCLNMQVVSTPIFYGVLNFLMFYLSLTSSHLSITA